jgi:uncharacterized protein
MVKKGIFAAITFVLFLFLLPMQAARAQEVLLNDLADVFTRDEKAFLQTESRRLSDAYAMDIVIVTTYDAQNKSSREYADDFFDDNGYGVGEDRDGILLLIDFDNSEVYISTSGQGIRYLTDQRIESILDDIFDSGFADGQYFRGATTFLTSTEGFLRQGIPAGQENIPEGENSLSLFDGLAGLLASGASGLGFFGVTKRKYKGHPEPGVFDYRSHSMMNLGMTTDNLVNSYTTSRIIPQAPPPGSGSSGAGRSTTHRSSSGRTHGGGGRKF